MRTKAEQTRDWFMYGTPWVQEKCERTKNLNEDIRTMSQLKEFCRADMVDWIKDDKGWL